jgi:hypothetical protein
MVVEVGGWLVRVFISVASNGRLWGGGRDGVVKQDCGRGDVVVVVPGNLSLLTALFTSSHFCSCA